MLSKDVISGLIVIGLQFAHPSNLRAQTENKKPSHQVVMELVSEDRKAWESVLNNIENLSASLGSDSVKVELVAHGGGLKMLEKKDNSLIQRMRSLSGKGVQFSACENTMKRKHVKRADLIDFVGTVDSGVAEVVRKQESGWSYIKSGN